MKNGKRNDSDYDVAYANSGEEQENSYIVKADYTMIHSS